MSATKEPEQWADLTYMLKLKDHMARTFPRITVDVLFPVGGDVGGVTFDATEGECRTRKTWNLPLSREKVFDDVWNICLATANWRNQEPPDEPLRGLPANLWFQTHGVPQAPMRVAGWKWNEEDPLAEVAALWRSPRDEEEEE